MSHVLSEMKLISLDCPLVAELGTSVLPQSKIKCFCSDYLVILISLFQCLCSVDIYTRGSITKYSSRFIQLFDIT